MASKKTRLLEPYGYRDQNEFDSNAGKCEEEIRGIKQVNIEQTIEINALLSGKVSTDVVAELSAYTLSSITRLDYEDELLWNAIHDEELSRKQADDELWNALSASTSSIKDEILDELEKERVARIATDEDIYSKLSGQTESVDSLSAMILTEISERQFNDGLIADRITSVEDELENALSGLSESLDAEISARTQGDVVLQDEIDVLSGAVDANTALIQALDEEINDEISGLNASVSAINASVSDLIASVDTLSGQVITAEYKADEAFQVATNLSGKVGAIVTRLRTDEGNISQNTEDIAELKDKVDSINIDLIKRIGDVVSAHTQDIEELKASDSALTEAIDTKADKDTVEQVIDDLAVLSGQVADNGVAIGVLSGAIDSNSEAISGLGEGLSALTISAQTLSDGLAQEIIDRTEGDKALLGETDDVSSAITIYGTRKLIKIVSASTLSSANTYTDGEIQYALEQAQEANNQLEDKINLKLEDYATWSGVAESYATKVYVDEHDGEIIASAKTYANELHNEVVSGYSTADAQLEGLINHNTVQINHITEFDWVENPGTEYEDSGNGVLDVLHREFHKFTGSTVIGSSLWESGTTEGIRAQVTDQTSPTQQPMIQIHTDGTMWLWIEDQWACLNEILKGLVGETY